MAMAAVATLVDGGNLTAADAFVGGNELRLGDVLARRQEEIRPDRRAFARDIFPQCGLDRGALLVARLRRDLEIHADTG